MANYHPSAESIVTREDNRAHLKRVKLEQGCKACCYSNAIGLCNLGKVLKENQTYCNKWWWVHGADPKIYQNEG